MGFKSLQIRGTGCQELWTASTQEIEQLLSTYFESIQSISHGLLPQDGYLQPPQPRMFVILPTPHWSDAVDGWAWLRWHCNWNLPPMWDTLRLPLHIMGYLKQKHNTRPCLTQPTRPLTWTPFHSTTGQSSTVMSKKLSLPTCLHPWAKTLMFAWWATVTMPERKELVAHALVS